MNITPGMYVEHVKGGHYQVLGIAIHTETGEEFVIYNPLSNRSSFNYEFFARPKSMFLDGRFKEWKSNV